MRPLAFAAVVVFVHAASAQEIGDKVMVVADSAVLRSNNKTTGVLPRGATLIIKKISGDSFWVTCSDGHRTVNGWIKASDVIPFSQALDFLTEELSRNPTPALFNSRGLIWRDQGDLDMAIADFNQAIRLAPKLCPPYCNRAVVWAVKREYDKAIRDLSEALRLDPHNAVLHFNRGVLWRAKGEYAKALSDLDEAIRFDANYSQAWNIRSYLASTCPDPRYRDGKKAVADAKRAAELGANDAYWSAMLAAAYAEAGDFEAAVKCQEKAIGLATGEQKVKWEFKWRSRLDLYKAHKPYREEPEK